MYIRKATEKDIDDIERIYDECLAFEEQGKAVIGWIRGVYPTEKTAREAVERGDMFVQEDENGTVTGSAIINRIQVDCYSEGAWTCQAPEDKVMVIHTLVISPGRGRSGLGSSFIDFYEDHAKEQGCTSLRLDTNAINKAARALYKKHGYTEVGIVPTVFNGIPDVDLVLLEKVINKPDSGR